jgi:NAD(P)-dependent dehydrogenase (short-subunit alcohol dehydrogenase family)
MFKLNSKTALITGAASGIGEAIANALSAAGARVIVADLDRRDGERVAQACATNGQGAHFLSLDVTDERNCVGVADTVRKEYGPLDILINNAGIGHVGTIEATDGTDLDRLYAVNVRGVFNVTKAFIGEMLARGAGVIVNIASIGGVVGIPDRLAYCTTKSAAVGLTKSLAIDHATQGIRVNCVCPGRVETPFVTARLREYSDPEEAYREMASSRAIGRIGKPEEIAAAVLYLVSDEAAFITGTALIIDGGWSAG